MAALPFRAASSPPAVAGAAPADRVVREVRDVRAGRAKVPRPFGRRSTVIRSLLSLLVGGALAAVAAAPLAGQASDDGRTAEPRPHGWYGALGLGLAANLGGSDAASESVGLGTHLLLTRRVAPGVRVGLQGDVAWFDGPFLTDRRLQVATVVEKAVGHTPFTLRAGPGLGFVSLVTVDGPPTDGVGDVDIGIGDESAWGFVTGVGAVLAFGDGWALAPVADLVYQRAGGFDLLTLVAGGRLEVGF